MAAEVGISEASTRRIWKTHGLEPHLVESFKIGDGPEFALKLEGTAPVASGLALVN